MPKYVYQTKPISGFSPPHHQAAPGAVDSLKGFAEGLQSKIATLKESVPSLPEGGVGGLPSLPKVDLPSFDLDSAPISSELKAKLGEIQGQVGGAVGSKLGELGGAVGGQIGKALEPVRACVRACVCVCTSLAVYVGTARSHPSSRQSRGLLNDDRRTLRTAFTRMHIPLIVHPTYTHTHTPPEQMQFQPQIDQATAQFADRFSVVKQLADQVTAEVSKEQGVLTENLSPALGILRTVGTPRNGKRADGLLAALNCSFLGGRAS